MAVIGFMATWWVGLWAGLLVGLIAFLFFDAAAMRSAVRTSFIVMFVTAVLFGIAGFLKAYYFPAGAPDWWFPENLIDKESFIVVSTIHNYSYAAGAVGLLLAVILMIRKKSFEKKSPVIR